MGRERRRGWGVDEEYRTRKWVEVKKRKVGKDGHGARKKYKNQRKMKKMTNYTRAR